MPIPLSAGRSLLALLLASLAAAVPAQYPQGAVVQSLPRADDPAERLAGALRTLAVSPSNLPALIAAGRNALILGDPNAAVGFFGRASEIAPRDGTAKAGLGSALVQLEQPAQALRLFGEASALGVPEASFAADRGLAYDLSGDPARAQRDYRTALAARPDDDAVRRRLALSQGIAGDRTGAIATLDPLIRKRDIAAWRAQTFVLAMTGDTAGANAITRVMLPQQQATLQPFLVRLGTLSARDKARAVTFGEMPAAGRSYSGAALATIGPPPVYGAAPRSDLAPVTARAATPLATAATTPPVRVAAAAPGAGAAAATVAPVPSAVQRPPASTIANPHGAVAPPVRVASAVAAPLAATPAPTVTTAAGTAVTEPPLPIGGDAMVGHFDLPHAAAPRVAARTVPSPVLPTRSLAAPPRAATPDAVIASAEPTPPFVRSAPPSDRPAPTRHIVTPPVEEADGSTHGRSRPAHESGAAVKTAKADSDDMATPSHEPRDGASRRGVASHGHAVRAAADEDETPPPPTRRGRHGRGPDDGSETAPPTRRAAHGHASDDDADTAPRPHASAKARKEQAADDAAARRKPGRRRADDDEDAAAAPARGSGSRKTKAAADKPDTAPRIYVQVAGGANRDDMDKAWNGVRKKAPDLMKGKKPSTTPLRATNRLLVGPFKDEDEAQGFVNKMAAKGLSGFVFKKQKGQKVDTVDAAR